MSDFTAKIRKKSISAGALPQTPLEELQRSPRQTTCIKGEAGGRGARGKGRGGEGEEIKEEAKRRGRKERGGASPQIFWLRTAPDQLSRGRQTPPPVYHCTPQYAATHHNNAILESDSAPGAAPWWVRLSIRGGVETAPFPVESVLFCSLAVLDPTVGHTMYVLSPFISVLSHSD